MGKRKKAIPKKRLVKVEPAKKADPKTLSWINNQNDQIVKDIPPDFIEKEPEDESGVEYKNVSI